MFESQSPKVLTALFHVTIESRFGLLQFKPPHV